jgi:hypothetical protein
VKIKSVTIRFNREILPFQHVRVELVADTQKKDEDVEDLIRKQMVSVARNIALEVEREIFLRDWNTPSDPIVEPDVTP